jgi:serine/threonine protein kinase
MSNANVTRESVLESLLLRFEELQEQRAAVTLDDLCKECPELLPELRRRVAALAEMDARLRRGPAFTGSAALDTHAQELEDSTGDERPLQHENVASPVATAPDSGTQTGLPRSFGRYELRALLGQGGMGTVYLAYDPDLDRAVAIKIPRPYPDQSGGWRKRFLGEARAAATLQHPNICPVFEVGEVNAQPYLAMALIEGETVKTRLSRTGKLAVPEALSLMRKVARAMAEAHERGIVHRDLKPSNIMIDRRYQPIVMDFGLALRSTPTDDWRVTLSGVVMGTPAYMSPEQAGGDHEAMGPPADVYAMGVILFEALTGRLPFEAQTFGKLIAQIERDPPPRPSALNACIEPAIEHVILKALEKQPQLRYASANAFADALDRLWDAAVGVHSTNAVASKSTVADRCAIRSVPSDQKPQRLKCTIVSLVLLALTVSGIAVYVNSHYGTTPAQSRIPVENQLVKRNAMAAESSTSVEPAATTESLSRQVKISQQAILVELPGWQILADATIVEMRQWLADRNNDRHSVVWLDSVLVGETPMYCAVAALDERATQWRAFLDLTEEEINDSAVLAVQRLEGKQHTTASLSGFSLDGKLHATALFQRGTRQAIIGMLPMTRAETELKLHNQTAYVLRRIRPFPTDDGQLWCCLYGEALPGQESVYGVGLTSEELLMRAERQRKDGYRPLSVVAYPIEGELRFAATFGENAASTEWSIRLGETCAKLQTTANEMVDRGLRPASVTMCPWDGAVRYYSVWMNQPSD